MKKLFYTMMMASLCLVACEKEFEPAAKPQAYPQEDARTLPTTFTIAPVESTIVIADQEEMEVKIGTMTESPLPSDATFGDINVILDDKVSILSKMVDKDLKVDVVDLQLAVNEIYGKRPEERTLSAVVKSSIQIEGQGFTLASNSFTVKVTPTAPVLDEHYYYVGAANSWSTTDKTYEFKNANGEDFYTDPVISVTIPAPVDDKGERADNWFKVAPGAAYDLDDFWSAEFIGALENGASDYEGNFVVGKDVGAFNVGPATEEALYYTITLNLLDQTYAVKALNFPSTMYMIGEEFGSWDWNSDGVVEMTPVLHNPDWGAEAEGQFYTVRYFTADKGFKFCSKRAWDGDFWGLTTNDGFTEAGGNCTVAEDGYYMVHIDLKNGKVHVEPARVYGIGDAFGGWDEEMESARFVADGKVLKATVAKAGNIRMYVASSIATSGWWTREFNVIEGKIVPRLMDELPGVPALANQVVKLDFNAGTGAIEGEGVAPTLPQAMFIIGEAINGWSDFVPMHAFHSQEGMFWIIRYLEADKAFKFSPVADWKGDFNQLDTNEGFETVDTNCKVTASGVYCIGVDCANSKIIVEPAKVYGIGDAFGGWEAQPVAFQVEGQTLVGTATTDGNIRTYVDSKILSSTNDWWHAEFIPKDGAIVYRETGGDPEAVAITADQKIIYDFNAGTAVIQ